MRTTDIPKRDHGLSRKETRFSGIRELNQKQIQDRKNILIKVLPINVV